jgi:SAM-dependent methyltransferase
MPTMARRPFAFGENWAAYSEGIDESHLGESIAGLADLLSPLELTGKRLIDIGCGSGLHAAAAIRLGAREVVAIDVDRASVGAAEATLRRFCPDGHWSVREQSVFSLDPRECGEFDVVYSWGALHHTGDLDGALQRASMLVTPRGVLAIALYRKTLLCPLWKIEKRWYSGASAAAQRRVLNAFIGTKRLLFRAAGRDFSAYLEAYKRRRGMEYKTDIHDWLGGWPYESITPRRLDARLQQLGLQKVKSNALGGYFLGRRWTELGSGCDEYVYRRPA